MIGLLCHRLHLWNSNLLFRQAGPVPLWPLQGLVWATADEHIVHGLAIGCWTRHLALREFLRSNHCLAFSRQSGIGRWIVVPDHPPFSFHHFLNALSAFEDTPRQQRLVGRCGQWTRALWATRLSPRSFRKSSQVLQQAMPAASQRVLRPY